ncbi:arginase [Tenacibaculum pacificus]|uniref:arginase n=1 Tax=Tenacibaculum pacificus TaxID=3018314 RepID=UPI0022F3A68C|nr:arginase [Tenacibaculum pacificus]WBX73036.1 arginase [Tenacibaculum pacificus]
MSSIKIIKNRSDIGAGTRGADMGIDAIEIAAINQNNDFFNRFEFEDVITENESIYDKKNNSFGKQIKSVFNQCKRVSNHVKVNLQEGNFPIVLSGDHSSALGTISGVKAANPTKKVGVIWIDAHGDLHTPYTSPSGNIHGMPLGAVISDNNLDCQINDVDRETADLWDRMKNIGTPGQKVLPEDIIFFGVRDTEEPEEKQMEKYGIKNYMVAEVRYRGLEVCVNEALEKLSNCDIIYVSFDVDAMDCDMISYGTGTPVAKGFDDKEIVQIINGLLASKKVACVEFVEVNPLLDLKGNKMAETAFDVLNQITETIKELY